MHLETERLILRILKPEDANAYFELSQNEGFRLFQISDYRRSSAEDARQWIEKVASYHQRNGFGIVGVFTKKEGLLVGLGALKYLDQERNSPVELMYRISDLHWGRGYGSEIASKLTHYAFNQAYLPSIVAMVDPHNLSSKKILSKLGFTFKEITEIGSFKEELHVLINTRKI